MFKSKYQRTVALSSAEVGVEYVALSLCTQEVLWVRVAEGYLVQGSGNDMGVGR